MKSHEHKQSFLEKIIASPIKALGKARDMYVRGVTKCNKNMCCNVPMEGFGGYSTFPRSYSTGISTRSEGNDDFAELIRVASARAGMDFDMKQYQQQRQQHQQQQQKTSKGLSKSSSVALPKIDEDKPFFEQDYYPRSKSYALGQKNHKEQDYYPRSKSYALGQKNHNEG
ncbi:hypothetical protein Lal_00045422 [Lupinus albus]|uniref:Uncharacterized protein n=1 Tax=Lupinus albus TaxID=3870 RepID=A0A6A5NRV1_LUPAL|nr:hypothetical protein Lalb_Chr14g0368111 [Lupinus albus]KAF1886192.1 hypothetical protein Lal_00045422 [Lupinus albus]